MYQILIVDDDEISLEIAKNCLGEAYHILTAASGEAAMQVMREVLPDLVLLDIGMPRMDGFEVITYLKSKLAFRNIPVIFLTASGGEEEEKGLSLGAVDFIRKPVIPQVLLMRVSMHIQLLEQKVQLEGYTKLLMENNRDLEKRIYQKTQSMVNLERAVISIVGDLIEGKDGYTGGHVVRVARYMEVFLTELYQRNALGNIAKRDVELIALFSKLHDVGKIAVAEKTLQKTTVLDVSENLQMRLHTVFGAQYIENAIQTTEENVYLRYAQQMARNHHEWWDGSGYPDNLKGGKIPYLARVVAICNAYDEICSSRAGQKGRTPEEAMRIIKNSSGTQFDPDLAAIFLELPLDGNSI